jgi:hypothetical protein
MRQVAEQRQSRQSSRNTMLDTRIRRMNKSPSGKKSRKDGQQATKIPPIPLYPLVSRDHRQPPADVHPKPEKVERVSGQPSGNEYALRAMLVQPPLLRHSVESWSVCVISRGVASTWTGFGPPSLQQVKLELVRQLRDQAAPSTGRDAAWLAKRRSRFLKSAKE